MNRHKLNITGQMLERIRFEYREYRRDRNALYAEAKILVTTTAGCDYIENAKDKLASAEIANDAMQLLHRLHRNLEAMLQSPHKLDMETDKPIGEDE